VAIGCQSGGEETLAEPYSSAVILVSAQPKTGIQ